MIDFEVKKVSNSKAVVEVRGDLNEMTRSYFFDCIRDLLVSEVRHVIIDCRGLGFLSSSSMSALLMSRKSAQKKSCKIYLTHVNSTIASALEFTKLNTLLAIFPTTEIVLAKLDRDGLVTC